MIVQLPNGRIIECSVEAYLDLTDNDIKDLNGLGVQYTKESTNPFYSSFSKDDSKAKYIAIEDMEEEYEPRLDEISEIDKRLDSDFLSDDI
tara:strand:+ start:1327 stop:1599 length:273 start_codon:yes stop_codon:yes gene_type:complete